MKMLCFILACALIWALFFKDQQPLPKAEKIPVLVPAAPLNQGRASKIIDGNDNVIWERQR